jgi:multiple sugar transport system substrate-binding protein
MTTVRIARVGITRRRFLAGLGGGASLALLAACSPSVPAPGAKPSESKPATEAKPAAPAAQATAAPAKPAEAQKPAESKPAEAAKPAADAKPAAQQAPAAQAGAGRVVTFWGRQQFLPESNAWFSESARMAAKEGGFEVKIELFSNDDHLQKEVIAMEAKQVPDVTMTTAAALWYQNGFSIEVQDLYDQIGRDGGGWFEAPEKFSLMNGKRIGIPLNVEPWIFHMRKDVFEEAGVKVPFGSWDEMVDGFKKVTKGGFYGFGGQMTNPDYAGNLLCAMMAHGGRMFDAEGRATLNTEKNLAGFTAYTDLFTTHKVMPPGVVQWDASGNNKAWLSGQVAAISNTGSTILSMRKDDQELLNKSVFSAWPGAGGNPPVTTADGFMLVINKGPNVEQAKQIVQKILSKERYPGNLEAAGSYWFSVLKRDANIDFFTKDPWNKQIQQEIIPHALAPFADGGRNPVFDDLGVAAMGDALQMVVSGKTPREAIQFLDAKAKEAEEKFKPR